MRNLFGPPFRLPVLLAQDATRDEVSRQLVQRIQQGEELKSRSILSYDDLHDVYRTSHPWHEANRSLLRGWFADRAVADWYENAGSSYGVSTLDKEIAGFRRRLRARVDRLHSILALVPAAVSPAEDFPMPTESKASPAETNNRVFVVHGHDGLAREQTARLLEKLGLKPVILSEQPSGGRTVIEKFEHHSDVGYAVVLLTPDDEGGASGTSERRPRARQNVILELGYFIGKLGRDRVCPIYSEGVEIPSDYHGIVYVPRDAGGAWKIQLAAELKAAGFQIDLNQAF